MRFTEGYIGLQKAILDYRGLQKVTQSPGAIINNDVDHRCDSPVIQDGAVSVNLALLTLYIAVVSCLW